MNVNGSPLGISWAIASKSVLGLFSRPRMGINPLLSTWKPFGLAGHSPKGASKY
jgi:hypothetical protein